jgi:Domain of unknown function (DUF4258)
MSTKDSLDKIVRDLKKGAFSYDSHALRRMDEREITSADIECLISEGLKKREFRSDHDSWNFFGHDLDNEQLTIAARYENGTTIVTVF